MSIQDLMAKSFLVNLFALARFSHAKKYVFKALARKVDPYTTFVLSKDKQRSLCIWAIKQIKHRGLRMQDDLYVWDLGGEKWLANLDHIHGLYEYLTEGFDAQYGCPCAGKVVLDIGGYIGDTARYFLKRGAREVIVYEPVEKNVVCLRHNLAHDQERVQIIPKGIAGHDGAITILSNYPPGHIGFGNRDGRYSLSVSVESFSTILSRVQADIAKVDCEGNEKYLLDVDSSLLRRIPYWMIEVHAQPLRNQLARLFERAGFEAVSMQMPPNHLPVYHYRLVC